MTEETTTTEQIDQTSTTENADLTFNDLTALKSIIDVASSRGAFKPSEMVAVGQTYTKLTSFLEAISKQADAAGAQ